MLDWAEAYTREALAAPVTLENARTYRWYQIGPALRSGHPRVYDDKIRPTRERLKRHGSAALDDLKGRRSTRSSP